MQLKKLIVPLLCGLIFSNTARCFEIDQIKSGMTKDGVKDGLKSWNFDRVVDYPPDTLIAFDLPEKNSERQFLFTFCNDKLVGFAQEIKPSAKNFIIVTNNYLTKYGQPAKVEGDTNVISVGEKNTMAMYWRKGVDFVGVKFTMLPTSEQLVVLQQANNNCWKAPR